jgi:serine/threonine protein kinase
MYAVKVLKIPVSAMFPQDRMSLEREMQIMKDSNHPLVIKYIESFLY